MARRVDRTKQAAGSCVGGGGGGNDGTGNGNSNKAQPQKTGELSTTTANETMESSVLTVFVIRAREEAREAQRAGELA